MKDCKFKVGDTVKYIHESELGMRDESVEIGTKGVILSGMSSNWGERLESALYEVDFDREYYYDETELQLIPKFQW